MYTQGEDQVCSGIREPRMLYCKGAPRRYLENPAELPRDDTLRVSDFAMIIMVDCDDGDDGCWLMVINSDDSGPMVVINLMVAVMIDDDVSAGGGVTLVPMTMNGDNDDVSFASNPIFPHLAPPPPRAHSSRHSRPLIQLLDRCHAYRRDRDACFAGVEAARGNGRRGDGVAR